MTPLAELHLHLYGCLRGARLLDMLAGARHAPSWGRYERAYERVYGAPSPARSLVERHRGGDPSARAEFERLFVFGDDDAGSFARFQAKFDLITVGSRIGLAYEDDEHVEPALEEIRTIARGVLDDQVREGIAYAEQRFFFGSDAPPDLVEAGLRELLAIYARETRMQARLAVSLPRKNPWSHWEIVQRLSASELGHVLTGVDFCFIEEGHPPKDQRALFAAVREHNERHPQRALAVLYHVGESFEDKSLESAVRWVHEAAELGAHRLGHAIALGVDPEAYVEDERRAHRQQGGPLHVRRETVAERRDQIAYELRFARELERFGARVDREALAREDAALSARDAHDELEVVYDHARLAQVRARQDFAMDRVRNHGAVVEVCPTSNLRIGGLRDPSHHPVRRFVDARVPIVVGSDDPGIFGTSVERELGWASAHLGLDDDGEEALRRAAWQHRSERISGRERG